MALLHGANFGWANLSKVDLDDARYDRHTTWPKDFDPQAEGADLED